jgi:hypothetical protein
MLESAYTRTSRKGKIMFFRIQSASEKFGDQGVAVRLNSGKHCHLRYVINFYFMLQGYGTLNNTLRGIFFVNNRYGLNLGR